MAVIKEDIVTREVECRLDALFDKDESVIDLVEADNNENFVLDELKAIVLSIDWEITDESMDCFINQINKLRNIYSNDKIIQMFLSILDSLGEYIKKNKSKAHIDAIKLMNSAFAGFEKVVLSKELSDAQKKKILIAEANAYKELKLKISSAKPKVQENEKSKVENDSLISEKYGKDSVQYDKSPKFIQEIIKNGLEEIKQIIKSESKSLRMELELLRKKMQRA